MRYLVPDHTTLLQVDRRRLTNTGDYHWVIEASDLNWAMWPHVFHCEGLGNGQPFKLQELERDREGEVTCARYRQAAGIVRITVFND